MPIINFITTTYVNNVASGEFDLLKNEFSGFAEGENNLCVHHDELSEWLEDNEKEDSSNLHELLTDIKEQMDTKGADGDIIFSR